MKLTVTDKRINVQSDITFLTLNRRINLLNALHIKIDGVTLCEFR